MADAKRRRALALLFIGALASASIVAGSLALFTDSDTVGDNAFTAGTIDLNTTPATAVIGFTDMLPGDTVTEALDVSNDGTGDLRYAVTSVSTDDLNVAHLKDVLEMTIYAEPDGDCDDDLAGTVIFGPAVFAGIFVGDPTTGPDAGDRDLASGTFETLCFYAELPSGAGNAYQAGSTTLTLTFASEQTAHNN